MPVYKYKSFEDAEKALWNFNPDERYFEHLAELYNFGNKLNPIEIPRGVFKFKTIEEANRHRERIELEHAKKRGAEILCEIRSIGMSGDGYDLVIPEPDGKGAEQSMRMAVDTGKIGLEELNYINTHGTSTPLGDVAEAKAVYRLVGGNEDHLNVSSTKSVHGHLLGATGAVEAIICIEAIRRGVVPPSINIDELDPEVPLSCINTSPVEREIGVAMSNSFGFGGHNSTVAFAKFA